MNDAIVSLESVDKRFASGLQALSGTSLRVAPGEFVTLIGPSGCGKSTVLRLAAGLEAPSAGRIGAPALANESAQTAFVFQEPTLMPWASVFDNVWLPLRLAGASRSAARADVEAVLAAVGLSEFAAAFPNELSGGMKMRVSIARALAVQPSILLMDEPFGALDEFTRNKLDSDLYQLWQQRGFTVVFVTHSIYEAVFLSSRVVVMAARPGRVIADVAIDAPPQRDEAYRVSQPFIDNCRILSEHLTRANRGER